MELSSNTLKEASRLLSGGSEKILTQPYIVTCFLWASILPSKTKCECGGLNLPGEAAHHWLQKTSHASVIKILVEELSDRLGLRLDRCPPNLNREGGTSGPWWVRATPRGRETPSSGWGASPSRRSSCMPAWRAVKAKIPLKQTWMETAMRDEPEDSLVVLQLLDSSYSPYRGGGSRPS